jgi:hypothetical protein
MNHVTDLAVGTISEGGIIAVGIGYIFSGLVLGIMAATKISGKTSSRVVSGLLGLGFLGYGIYLLVGDPQEVWISFKIFLVPIAAIVYIIAAAIRRGKQPRSALGQFGGGAPAAGFAPQGQPPFGQPAPFGQPQPGQPAPFGQPQPGPNQFGQPAQQFAPTAPGQARPQYPGAPQDQPAQGQPQYPGAPQAQPPQGQPQWGQSSWPQQPQPQAGWPQQPAAPGQAGTAAPTANWPAQGGQPGPDPTQRF